MGGGSGYVSFAGAVESSSRTHVAVSLSHRRRMRAGTPAAIVAAGTSPRTTEFAPMTAPSPIRAPGKIAAPSPIQTFFPIETEPVTDSGRRFGLTPGAESIPGPAP
jgi:hypothetical protein